MFFDHMTMQPYGSQYLGYLGVQPRDGIISLGAGNYFGHPHPRVLATLHEQNVRVWRTDIHGAVTVSTDGSTYEILTHGPAPKDE